MASQFRDLNVDELPFPDMIFIDSWVFELVDEKYDGLYRIVNDDDETIHKNEKNSDALILSVHNFLLLLPADESCIE